MESGIKVIPDEMNEKSSTIEEQIEAPVVEDSIENSKKNESTDVESISENQTSEQVVQNSDENGYQNIEVQKCEEKNKLEKQLMVPVMEVCAVDDADNDTNITDAIEEEPEVLPDEINNIDESGLSPKSTTANDDIPPSESEPFTVLDSDNPSECSPEKSHNSEKENKIDLLSLLSSPSQTEPDDSFSQNQLGDEMYDEEHSIDESNEDENDTDEDNDRNKHNDRNDHNDGKDDRRPIDKQRLSSTFKKSNDYPVFELTDDNSSEDDMRSDEDEEYISDAQSMSSVEDIVHNIDDSDDEPEQKCTRNIDQMSSPVSAKYYPKETENRYGRHFYDDQEEQRYMDPNYTQRRNYIRDVLQKQSASKLYRYMAVKRSITCLNNRIMRDSRGINRISGEFNDDIESGSASNLEHIRKSSSIDVSVLKERNANENTEPTLKLSNESNAKSGKSTNEADNKKCASVNDANNKCNNQITNEIDVNDLTINLDLDEIGNDHLVDKEKCAKRILDDDNELGMDVDDPSEELYLTEKTDTNRYDRLDGGAKRTIKSENTVTIECEEESSKSIGADENNVIMNGTNKDGQSSDSTNANDENEITVVRPSGKSNKRKISISSDEDSEPPSKTARTDVEINFPRHDKIIRRMIESSNSAKSNDPDTLQRDIDQLNSEIETLGEAARTKEIEWNNILYLKKMKEDMLLRLSRQKTIMEIMQSTKSIDNPESLFLNNNFDNINEMNAMESKKTLGNVAPATSFIMSRCNMKSVDLAKEKSNLNELYRNIQPKTSQRSDASATFSNVITSIPKSSPAMQFQTTLLQQRLRENGQSLLSSTNQMTDQSSNKLQIGRQGQIKDVQSIIANFRQTHPEAVPRRGRRLKTVNQGYYLNEQGISSAADATDALVAEMLSKHNNDLSSPQTSNDSNYSNSQIMITKAGPSNHFAPLTPGNFKQAFNENSIIAGMSLKNNSLLTSTPLFKNRESGIGYPEVTLHPIQSTMLQNQKHVNDNMSDAHANSLLHGILTKKLKGSNAAGSNVNATGFNNAFSPTLARLLTAPERNIALTSALTGNSAGGSSNHNNNNNNNHFFTNQTTGINLSKTSSSRTHESKPEISCLPISQILALQQQQQQQQQQQIHQNNSLLQQQLQRNQRDNINKLLPKNNVFNLDDEADDSDRLIIDEGDQYSNSEIIGGASNKKDDSPDGELPECQGCKKREAQFVCADCKSQWYCSRECQVMAWDEHSEVCAR